MSKNTIGYFQFGTNDLPHVIVVRKSFWDKNKCINDKSGHDPKLPSCLYELCESTYEWDREQFDESSIRNFLIEQCWEEKQLF